MALSIEDLKNMASVVIEKTTEPTHVGTGQHLTADDTQSSTNTTVIDGDNHGGIRQSFRR